MTDIASLRLSIDSRPLADGKAALSEFDAAQKRVALSASTFEQAARRAANSVTLNTAAMRQLSFQANDVATMFAMGASPFQILASQGGQVYQAFSMHPGGAAAGVRDLGRQVVGFLGPLGLLATGFTAAAGAAYGFYALTHRGAPTAEQLLDEHARLLSVVKRSYDNATGSVRHFYEQGREAVRLQLLQQQVSMTEKLREATGRLLQTALAKDFASFFGAADPQIATKFKPFAAVIYSMNEGLQAGTPNVRQFVDEVARIGLQNPALQKTAAELIKSSGDASTFAAKLREIDAQLKLLNGGKLTTLEQKGLGLGDASRSINAYDSLIQRTKDRNAELRLEAQTAGQVSSAVAAMRLQHEAERAARQAGVSVNQQVLDQLKEELATRQRVATIAKMKAEIDFDLRTIGLSDIEARIAKDLKVIYGNDVQSALDSALATQLRFNELLRQGRDLAVDFGTGMYRDFSSGLRQALDAREKLNQATRSGIALTDQERQTLERQAAVWGVLQNAAVNALQRIGDKLAELAISNAVTSMFGGATGGGGLFSSLLGGGGGLGGGAPGNWGFYQFGGQNVPVAIAHQGGVIGRDVFPTRWVDPAIFTHAPRFHGGGEVPIIAQAGEEVLTRDNPRHRANGGGEPINFTYAPVIDARGADQAAVARLEKIVERQGQDFESRVKNIVRKRPRKRW